ncbi:Uncharacterised protein [Mycobacteroides abscessus subsp. massiliense]|nr:Uncharacterised protein [Mycobacteroides abscessus subsp. massiliense]SKG95398.1 Uncharacterised protein [Mycobacteroides abscessus subsp. massiliense]SKH76997.1 Uncharacterised protein [Mycobacteroides abscessus subsp. massiliense]SKI58538.1 Uncharacterised protein [Mycobacteroides abscessus subsp. massiliense]SKI71346.1 Uncharacterised protein [Mycobacteroides abscessus subsp. massiliense]
MHVRLRRRRDGCFRDLLRNGDCTDTGFTESSVLQPLKRFGFHLYSRPRCLALQFQTACQGSELAGHKPPAPHITTYHSPQAGPAKPISAWLFSTCATGATHPAAGAQMQKPGGPPPGVDVEVTGGWWRARPGRELHDHAEPPMTLPAHPAPAHRPLLPFQQSKEDTFVSTVAERGLRRCVRGFAARPYWQAPGPRHETGATPNDYHAEERIGVQPWRVLRRHI